MDIKPHGHKIPLLSRKKNVNVDVNTSLLRNTSSVYHWLLEQWIFVPSFVLFSFRKLLK